MYDAPSPKIYRRVLPPCKVDGVDCQDRRIGCRADCSKWDDYQEQLREEKDRAWNTNAGSFMVSDYKKRAASDAKRRLRR